MEIKLSDYQSAICRECCRNTDKVHQYVKQIECKRCGRGSFMYIKVLRESQVRRHIETLQGFLGDDESQKGKQ